MASKEYVEDIAAVQNRLGCSEEEAEYINLVANLMGAHILPFQEEALLELRRAHKDGRRPNLTNPMTHPYYRRKW